MPYKDPQKQKAYFVEYHTINRKRNAARSAVWRIANPDKVKVYRQRYKALKRHAPLNDLTAAQWTALQVAFNHRCAYCGKHAKGKLTVDHITPLSKGGSHTLSNIVPACMSCNCRKQAGPVLSPVQPFLLILSLPRKKREKS